MKNDVVMIFSMDWLTKVVGNGVVGRLKCDWVKEAPWGSFNH